MNPESIQLVKNAVENVLELTPREYDLLYSDDLNKKAHIDHVIIDICEDHNIIQRLYRETGFIRKRMLFAVVWPEYYKENYRPITAEEILDAKGDLLRALIRAGKPREPLSEEIYLDESSGKNPTRRITIRNHGVRVDALLYEALQVKINTLADFSVKDLFLFLADPKKNGWNKYGIVKAIEV